MYFCACASAKMFLALALGRCLFVGSVGPCALRINAYYIRTQLECAIRVIFSAEQSIIAPKNERALVTICSADAPIRA